MYKEFAVLLLIATLARSELQNAISLSNNYDSSSVARTDDYIKLNRQQYAKTIQDYDNQMLKFRQHYYGRLDGIIINQDMLTNALVQTEERLNPLELLSDFNKGCVTKYRSSIPTVANTKSSITSCVTTAKNQVDTMLTNPVNTRNSLYNYYNTYFEAEVKNCEKKFTSTTTNYTSCVATVTTTTNSVTIGNQKTFGIQMDAADCLSNANIKTALDCSYIIQQRTLSQIAESNVLINRCLTGEDVCKPCDNTCSDVYNISAKEIDYKSETMRNPFYEHEKVKDCLLLKIQ